MSTTVETDTAEAGRRTRPTQSPHATPGGQVAGRRRRRLPDNAELHPGAC